jgi:hypothetical protein
MTKHESTYDKKTFEIIDFKEYHNNHLIKHHINGKKYKQINHYDNGKLYMQEINQLKNNRLITKTINGNGEILKHKETDINGNIRLEVFNGQIFKTKRDTILILRFKNNYLSKKYDYYAYKLYTSQSHLNQYYILLETHKIIEPFTYVRYSKKYPVTQDQYRHRRCCHAPHVHNCVHGTLEHYHLS